MSSACLVARRSPFSVAPCSRLRTKDACRPAASDSRSALWRPWLAQDAGAAGGCPRSKLSTPYSRPTVPGSLSSDGKPQSFQHPVRLFWPKSKSFDYLYSDGEVLLRNFPIQATISFYDESDSDDDDDDDDDDDEGDDDSEEEADSEEECLKPQSHFTSYN
ncbi:protein ripply1 [Gadus chalcogrammus]|uniref:protein ripply1 n=1 Tax=Gadus chalcogrammus TaxID=1042646 RepID=UPI0024C4B52E|nr:protein ripply1 [Gadus chalcogrammus]